MRKNISKIIKQTCDVLNPVSSSGTEDLTTLFGFLVKVQVFFVMISIYATKEPQSGDDCAVCEKKI